MRFPSAVSRVAAGKLLMTAATDFVATRKVRSRKAISSKGRRTFQVSGNLADEFDPLLPGKTWFLIHEAGDGCFVASLHYGT